MNPNGTADPTPEIVRDLAPTGTLRAAINLGNPVLAHGTDTDPGGVSVAITRVLGDRLKVPVQLICVDAARKSLAALTGARADIAFLAIEPAREQEVAFSPAYVNIDGVYAVSLDATFEGSADVDRAGVRIGVKEGSAYDLFLTRTVQHADVIRGTDGTDVFLERGLEVAAGIRQPLTAFVGHGGTHRLLEPAFMRIQQAVGVRRDRSEPSVAYLAAFVRELVASGFVRTELASAGHDPALATVHTAAGPSVP